MILNFTGTHPTQANPSDAGYDLRSIEMGDIAPGAIKLIQTDLKMAIPEGYAGCVASRSGLAKNYVFVANQWGLLDPAYRGQVGVLLFNAHPHKYFDYTIGDRIAQLVLIKVERPEWVKVDSLDATVRGDGGFGSSGLK